jgi:long-subunit acyl-CoA synthetase (AMP-forming)
MTNLHPTPNKSILDYVYDHESTHPERLYLIQPTGRGQVAQYNWGEVVGQARRMATHLKSLGYEPGARIAILSKNCAHFFMTELAIWMAGYTTVSIFPTESAEIIGYVLQHSDARLLFVGKLDTWAQQAPGVPGGLPRIALPLAPATDYEKWDDIIARTAPMEGRPLRDPDDIAMLIYTSGSTGQPKGVMHSFGRIARAAPLFVETVGLSPDDRMISYLPLAHVTERAVIACTSMVLGCQVFFSESLDTFLADLQRARPTLFVSVPRLWTKFQLGVFSKMPPKKLDFLLSLPILGKIVGRKVLAGLGLDQVRLAASGSAPISAELIKWYRRLGLNLLEGYGMSEDFALSHLSTKAHNAPGYVGRPYPGVEVRISPESEVLIKSPGQMIGYFKQPELTAQAFTEDGFFRTGDQGERREDGLLKITGRLKEQFKTGKGKYVVPAPIENDLNDHPMIELSMVSGVGEVAAYALVMLAEDLRPKLGDPAVRANIESELTHLLDQVNATLSTYEQMQMLVIAREPWSIENGLLTPTLKIRRNRIEATVAPQLKNWYESKGKVLWA